MIIIGISITVIVSISSISIICSSCIICSMNIIIIIIILIIIPPTGCFLGAGGSCFRAPNLPTKSIPAEIA